MLTLTDFLLARIAEDEERAYLDLTETPRTRLLAECEAKRRIVEAHVVSRTMVPMRGFDQPDYEEPEDSCAVCDWVPTGSGCDTIRLLALPYADHPDYREEWKP